MRVPCYSSLSGRIARFVCPQSVFLRWAFFPYGIWLTASGRQVLFNRFYEPIWQRHPDGRVEPADPKEWVADITAERWFYDDTCSEQEKRAMARCPLQAWGLPDPERSWSMPYRRDPQPPNPFATAGYQRWLDRMA